MSSTDGRLEKFRVAKASPQGRLDYGLNVSGQSEAEVRVADHCDVSIAIRGTQVARTVVPGAPAENVTVAIAISCATITRISGVAVVPAIVRPFPEVAMDVEKTPRVGLEAINCHCLPPKFAFGSSAFVGRGSPVVVGLPWCDR